MTIEIGTTDELRRGLDRLRLGALLEIAAFVLVIIGMIVLFSVPGMYSLITRSFSGGFPGSPPLPGRGPTTPPPLLTEPGKLLVALGVSGGLMLIAGILGIISFVLWFMATGNLKRYSERLGVGRTGMILQLLAVIIIIVGAVGFVAFVAVSAKQFVPREPSFGAFTGLMTGILGLFGVVIIGVILAIIGGIMFGLMLMRMPEEGLDDGFKTAGIVYLAGVVTSLIPFVSLISIILELISVFLIYRSSKRNLESLEEGRTLSVVGES